MRNKTKIYIPKIIYLRHVRAIILLYFVIYYVYCTGKFTHYTGVTLYIFKFRLVIQVLTKVGPTIRVLRAFN